MISIIIPVYNKRETIGSTLDSILNQTYGDRVQIILMLDGSSDGSEEICHLYVRKYKNIEAYVNKDNYGTSSARNQGLSYVKNKYIWFVDADDIIEDNSIKVIYETLECNDIDILFFDYMSIKNDEKVFESTYDLSNIKQYDYHKDVLLNYIYGIKEVGWPAWLKIVKYTYIIENAIFFDETLKYSEDVDWSLKIITERAKIEYINANIYDYYIFEKSNSHGNIDYEHFLCAYRVCLKWYEYIKSNTNMKELKRRFELYYCNISRMIPYIEENKRKALELFKMNYYIVTNIKGDKFDGIS